jgi:hypothetical protein
MGMAASQARFLGLTARKTNTEYEGQQINQQRTTLSNQSANYYNQLLGMTVPVPPSVSDYTKTVYTFTDGSLSNSLTSMIAQQGGTYLVSYTSTWTDDFAAVSASSSIVSKAGDGSVATDYKVGAKTLRNINDAITFTATYTDKNGEEQTQKGLYYIDGVYYYEDANSTTEAKNEDGETDSENTNTDSENTNTGAASKLKVFNPTIKEGTSISYSSDFANEYNDEYLKTLSVDQIVQLQEEEKNYISILKEQYGGNDDDWAVRYVQNSTTGTWSPYFTKLSTLQNATYDDNTGSSLSYIGMYTIGSAEKSEEIKGVTARLEQDSTGRIINITLNPDEEDAVTYAVTTNTSTDQSKYDDAMNQYEYEKYQYDQSIQEINAKIEVIQSEDKNLELRLKQLDTEQDAIQTEMDAVQKVIEKNTESTFKTFG